MAKEPTADIAGEATLFAAYLSYFRDTVAEAVLALPEHERRTTRLSSGWTPIELLSHLLHMEQRWFVWGFLGERVEAPWGDWSREDPWEDDADGAEARWLVADDVTPESLVARLQELGARMTRLLAEHDLDEVPEPSPRFDDDIPTLRWICFHVLHEYARHAGHLDIAVELAGAEASAGQD
jgi:uncharacterized damage-inducible protein DinB